MEYVLAVLGLLLLGKITRTWLSFINLWGRKMGISLPMLNVSLQGLEQKCFLPYEETEKIVVGEDY